MSKRRWGLAEKLTTAAVGPRLSGARLLLRPLVSSDFAAWQEVRRRCGEWLTKWEPRRAVGVVDAAESRRAFDARCEASDRERASGTAFRFGIFRDGRFVGEINVGSVQRGAYQNAYVGYWIDEAVAGSGYMPEAVVCVLRFAFEDLGLHRVQISIIPRNASSRRVPEKLALRNEGIAERYLEINGVWEDHVRYAMTVEEWWQRREELVAQWLTPSDRHDSEATLVADEVLRPSDVN
jgi:[ribosomal protein S5]-alanine N-acetyltransferase